jgi:hypothetical protein
VGSGVGAAVGTAIATDGKEDGAGHDRPRRQYRDDEEYGDADPEYLPPRHQARPNTPPGHLPPPAGLGIS